MHCAISCCDRRRQRQQRKHGRDNSSFIDIIKKLFQKFDEFK